MWKWLEWIGRLIASALLLSFLSIWTTGYIVNSYMETLLQQLNIPLDTKPLALSGVWGKLWGAGGSEKRQEARAEPAEASGKTELDARATGETEPPAGAAGEAKSRESGPAGDAAESDGDGGRTADPDGAIGGEAPDEPTGTEEDAAPVWSDRLEGEAADVYARLSDADRQRLYGILLDGLSSEQLRELSGYMEGGLTVEEIPQLQALLRSALSPEQYEQIMAILLPPGSAITT